MTDTYLTLVNTGVTKKIATQLGLPRPVPLRRYEPGQPLLTGPVLVLHDAASVKDADVVADTLVGWDLDVRRHAGSAERYSAVLLVLTGATHPQDLSAPVLEAAGTLRSLAPAGRVVTLSRPATADDAPAVAATRQGVDGLLRSLAKELRAGATGNGIVVADGVGVDAPSALGTLRFFLSARSAFVDGQLLAVDTAGGALPDDWDAPLTGRVAVVTGAARGIGAAIAETLARDGATVVGVDVPSAGEALARVANRIGGTALQLDITVADAAERLLGQLRQR